MTIETIKENDYAILKTEKSARLVQLSKKVVFVDKRKFHCADIIGQPWGQVFQMSGGKNEIKLSAVARQDYIDHLFSATEQVTTERSGQDNRQILDENQSQKLTREEIEQFKNDGATTVNIVQSLVENSDSYKEKTNYSQQKYLKKKLKKYDCYFQAVRPSIRALAELYWSQNALKLGMLRPDSLALMLSQANILPKGKYLVLDSYLGLLTAAVMERCSEGKVIQVLDYSGHQSSSRQAVQATGMNYERLISVDYYLVEKLANGLVPTNKCSEDPANDRRVARFMKNLEALRLLMNKDFDGLLVNTKGDTLESTLVLIKFLKLSRNFVVFTPYLNVITTLYDRLKTNGGTAMLKISESWIRRHQVLENRTHPEINMQSASGYLLSGIKCE